MAGPRALTIVRSGALVALGTFAANVISYLFVILLARSDSPADFGAVSALLALSMIASIPAVSLQLLVAREVARRSDHLAARPAPARSWGIGAVTGALVALAAPLVGWVTHLPIVGVLGVAAMTVPFTAASADIGVALGRRHMGRYATSLVVMASAKLAAGVVATRTEATPTGIVWILAGLTLLASLLVHVVAGAHQGSSLLESGAISPRGLAVISSGVAGFVVLSSADTLLARSLLTPDEAGQYAAGTIFTRIALWGLQFVALTVYPLAASGSSLRLRRASAALVLSLGALGTLLAWSLGPLLTQLLVGDQYPDVGSLAWLFTAYGALLAALHLALTTDMAVAGRVVTLATWTAVAALVLLAVSWPSLTVASLLGVACGVVVGCDALVLARQLGSRRAISPAR